MKYMSTAYCNNRGRKVYVQFKDISAKDLLDIHNKKPFRATSKRGSGITQTLNIQVASNKYLDVFQGNYSGQDVSFQLAKT